MNRSVERLCLAVSGVRAGEVVVVPHFTHPHRGRVPCPAAPVVAASLARSGLPVRRTELADGVGGVLFVTSYLDRDGRVNGFGVATSVVDPEALCVADEAVAGWSATLRTRRALVAVLDSGCTADSACRTLAVTRRRVRQFADRGDTVVAVGPSDLRLPGAVAVRTVAAVDDLTGVDPDRLSFVVAPGAPVEEAAVVLAALRARFPRLRGQHPDELCYCASDRREAVRSVAAACDLLLVCGRPRAVDTRRLMAWAYPANPVPHQIDDAGQLRADWLASASSVGIVAAASAGPGLVDNVLQALAGLGPLSIASRAVVTLVGRPATVEEARLMAIGVSDGSRIPWPRVAATACG